MSEMRRLLQAGALIAERCDDIQYFEDRYGVQAGSIANVSLIDSPLGPAMYWSGDCTFRILDHRTVPQVRDATNWSLLAWAMFDGTYNPPTNPGFVSVGGNAGQRITTSPGVGLDIRYRADFLGSGNQVPSPFSPWTFGKWYFTASILDSANSLYYQYEGGQSIASSAVNLNDTLDPASWSYDGIAIGEEWGGSKWRGGIYAVALFPFTLTQDELDDIYGGNF
jgi:hypothetical protein